MYDNTCLKGVRVLDISSYNSGPIAGQVLGDLGADVIKIERPTGDPTRKFGPFVEGESLYYQHLNRNKKGITLNFTKGEGKEIFLKLVEKADVVLENLMPGQLAKYGLDYESLAKINPRLIMCSITGYGQKDSPYVDRPAFDITTQAFSGIVSLTGPEGLPGVKVGPPVCDQMSGYWGALAIIACLYERTISGKGQQIDLAMVDVGANAIEHWIPAYGLTQAEPPHCGNAWPGNAPAGAYASADGPETVFISTANDKQAETVITWAGHPELIGQDIFASSTIRGQNRHYINGLINEFTAKLPKQEIVKQLSELKIPCAPVNTVKDVYEEPHYRQHREIVEFDHPVIGKVPLTVTPFRPQRTPLMEMCAGPVLGSSNETIFKDELGMTDAQIAELKEKGFI